MCLGTLQCIPTHKLTSKILALSDVENIFLGSLLCNHPRYLQHSSYLGWAQVAP